MNKYFTVTIGLLMFFVLLSILVSPNINSTDSTLLKADNSAFISINKSHISALDQFMVYLTFFGREYFWIPVIILLFIFGGWAGKKAAISMAISFCLTVEAGLVCFSRIYVGGHYPLDVLAGIGLGAAVSSTFIGVIKNTE